MTYVGENIGNITITVDQMISPTIKLEEQLADLRSNQIAYKLTIENRDSSSIRLITVEPRMPVGVTLLSIRNSSLAESNEQKIKLERELNRLLNQFLWVKSEPFRQRHADMAKENLKEIFSFNGFLSFYLNLILGFDDFQKRWKRDFDSLNYSITSSVDARAAYDKWLANSNEHMDIVSIFKAKMEQLEHINASVTEPNQLGLTTIESGSLFTATYVLEFPRGVLEPRKYQIAFDSKYMNPDLDSSKNISTATSVQISPYPLALSAVAIFASVLGVLLNVCLGIKPHLQGITEMGQFFAGAVVALTFFNVYEYTSLGKSIVMPLSWRSALLIGILCGIAQDRILLALKTLIGG